MEKHRKFMLEYILTQKRILKRVATYKINVDVFSEESNVLKSIKTKNKQTNKQKSPSYSSDARLQNIVNDHESGMKVVGNIFFPTIFNCLHFFYYNLL
jgi:hypothetical protein